MIQAWALELHKRSPGSIAVCLELAKGPLVQALERYNFCVIFPVNPAPLAGYRQAFVPSRAKDDPTDAELTLDLLLHHRDKLQPFKPQSPAMQILAALVEERRSLARRQDMHHQSFDLQPQGILPACKCWSG